MSIRMIVVMLTVGLLAFGAASSDAEAQPSIPPLPADLLFTTATWTGGGETIHETSSCG
jgi:hypothetical protein